MKRCSHSILDFVGNTPMLELSNINTTSGRIFAKVEYVNPGGSIKTRTACGMIEDAEQKGLLNNDSVLVEPTSGNQGIGIAMVAAIKGYQAKIVMPACMSMERKKIVESFGAEIVISPEGKDIKETFDNCKKYAERLAEQDSLVFIPNQFENPANPKTHMETTAVEILSDIDEQIDAFIAGVGTGGTLTGVGSVLKQKYPKAKVIAVEPENSAVLSGGSIGNHIQQGIGDGFIPGVLDQNLIDDVIVVKDDDALNTAKMLGKYEGAPVGISSGTNVWAAHHLAKKLPSGARIVTVLPDGIDRYYSTSLCSYE